MEEVFAELSSLPCEQPERRDICKRCRYAHHYVYVQTMCAWLCVYPNLPTSLPLHRRPSVVCVCSCFPDTPVTIETRIIILQHPNEVCIGLGSTTCARMYNIKSMAIYMYVYAPRKVVGWQLCLFFKSVLLGTNAM